MLPYVRNKIYGGESYATDFRREIREIKGLMDGFPASSEPADDA